LGSPSFNLNLLTTTSFQRLLDRVRVIAGEQHVLEFGFLMGFSLILSLLNHSILWLPFSLLNLVGIAGDLTKEIEQHTAHTCEVLLRRTL
jgi:hypothetical protein